MSKIAFGGGCDWCTELACSEGYKLDLKLFPLTKNKDRNIQGTIEVWFSPRSVKKITNKKSNCYL